MTGFGTQVTAHVALLEVVLVLAPPAVLQLTPSPVVVLVGVFSVFPQELRQYFGLALRGAWGGGHQLFRATPDLSHQPGTPQEIRGRPQVTQLEILLVLVVDQARGHAPDERRRGEGRGRGCGGQSL